MNHPPIPSGPWTEHWSNPTDLDDRYVNFCEITFDASGALKGSGHTKERTNFTLAGSFDAKTGAVRWRKRSDFGVVAYVGAWDPSTGQITGRWRHVQGFKHGRFSLTPGSKQAFEFSAPSAQEFMQWRAKGWQSLCAVDLEALRFDGERAVLQTLLADADYVRKLQWFHSAYYAMDDAKLQRRVLADDRVRLTRHTTPGVFAVIDRCARTLGLTAPVAVFCAEDSVLFASATVTSERHVVLEFSSGLLNTLNEDELAHVAGHEIGHAILGHLDTMAVGEDEELPMLVRLQSCALERNEEISADRMGLLCSKDLGASLMAQFKTMTGITRPSLLGDPNTVLETARTVLAEVSAEIIRSRGGEQSHPYWMQRIAALDLFARSTTYRRLLGQEGGELTEADMETQVDRLMALMAPSVLAATIERDAIAEFLLLSAVSVALATGKISTSEDKVIQGFARDFPALLTSIQALSFEEQQVRTAELAETLSVALPWELRVRLLEDALAVARAGGKVTEAERAALIGVAGLIGIDEETATAVMNAAQPGLD